MNEKAEDPRGNRFCKACGTPAEDGRLCEYCGSVLGLPDDAGLVEDQGVAARRVFEGDSGQRQHP
ncbi:hypothetical protein [Streptomyces candidus]|uniref:Zinc ribbon domain-containing protein n=1 Tax=Streptomyces candidus TaxID=67283 RepID=A0A7X0HLN5_9ACTN|nr:hypothetical protein [Streptomyces candidus]MBB6439758.1 hypothetical protein [Streptomyces candidus]